MTAERASDTLRIATADQYREAVEEVQHLGEAREGSPEFQRRQALRAALADYEERHKGPEWTPGGPA